MNIVICDDEKTYIDSIVEKIRYWAKQKNLEGAISIQSFTSSEDLLQAWSNGLSINMLFVDYKIPNEMNGLDLAKQIRLVDVNMPIAFITNFADYACDGYTVNAIRYILKPVSQKPISECMDIAYTRWIYLESDSLKLETNRQVLLLPYKEIRYIESLGHNVCFYTVNSGTISVRARLSDYEKIFPPFIIKVHRSYDINIMYVRKIQGKTITLAGEETVPLSRSCSNVVHSAFIKYNIGVL